MGTDRVLERLPALIKAKRREGNKSLRQAALDSGVSPSTLSRLERGTMSSVPDTETLSKLTSWLSISIETLLNENGLIADDTQDLSTPEKIEVHLRADKDLSPETAKALAESFRLLYNQFVQSNKGHKER